MTRDKFLKILLWLAVLFWLVIIFGFSASDGPKSDSQSSGFITNTISDVASIAQNVGIRDHSPSDKNVKFVVNKLNPLIRKIAHATVYFILAILLLLALGTKKENFIRNALLTVLLCFLYALTDEYHQTFVPGRAGMFTDCLIDTSGAVVAVLVYRLGMFMKAR